MPTIETVWALESAAVPTLRRLIERGGRGFYRLPVLSFALETDAGWYLVDAGMGDVLREVKRRVPYLEGLTLTRPLMHSLEDLGVSRRDLRGALMTHLDWDHTGALPDLPDVPVHVARAELQHARQVLGGPLKNPLSPRNLFEWSIGRYRGADVGAPRTVHEVEPKPALDLYPGARAADLFGDGSVRLLDLAGHTAGHAGFLVRLADGRQVLLAGDAAFSVAQIEGTVPLGPLPRLMAYDLRRFEETLGQLRALQLAQPDLVIVTSHEEALGQRAANGPIAL